MIEIQKPLNTEEAKKIFAAEAFCFGGVDVMRASKCVRLLGFPPIHQAVALDLDARKYIAIYLHRGRELVFFTLDGFLTAVTYRNLEITFGNAGKESQRKQNSNVIDFSRRAKRKKAAIGAGTPTAASDTTQGSECVKCEYITEARDMEGAAE